MELAPLFDARRIVMSQLWKSDLNPGLHPRVERMNQSISVDSRLWKEDIEGSKVHVKMLMQSKLISDQNGEELLVTLNIIQNEIELGHLKPLLNDEDVHSWIERELVSRLGAIGSNVHIARSRNEQVLLDVKLYLRPTLSQIDEGFKKCLDGLKDLENRAEDTTIPSYTHLRRAQPIYLKEYWESHRCFWEETQSEFNALKIYINKECPMGAGAIHGTTLPTSPEIEASLMGFEKSPRNSIATISSRRFILRFLSICTHWLLDLSRLMEDLIIYSTEEFNFISFGSDVTTGSSMMPQKRNPDLCELIRGKSATVLGHYVGAMALMKNLPMGYMKDLQEDKVHLFAVVDIVHEVLEALPILLNSIQIHRLEMEAACNDPQLLATDLLEALVLKGVPLREAHHRVACWVSKNKNYLHPTEDQGTQILVTDSKTSCEKRFQKIQRSHQFSFSEKKEN
jgi:argininosuccinate lyase